MRVRHRATFGTDVDALWLRLDLEMRARAANVLVVAGVGPFAGATTLCAAMASTAAAGSPGLTLVDASPGPNGLAATLGLAGLPGTGDALAGAADEGVTRNGLRVLPVGDQAAVGRATSPEAWRGFFSRLRPAGHGRVIVDAGDAASTTAMAAMAASDAVVVVVRAGRCRWEQVTAAVASVRTLGPPLLGVVLNDRGFAIPGPLYRRL